MKSNLRYSVSEVYKKSNNEKNTLFNNSLLNKMQSTQVILL